MRKTSFFLLLCLFSLYAGAEELSTMLLHGGKYTQFIGSESFRLAYDAAVEGDTIIFSPGLFSRGPSYALPEIKKNNLHLIGSGAFDPSQCTNLVTLYIKAEGVTIENVVAGITVIGSHSRLKGCYCSSLNYTNDILYNGGAIPSDNIVSQCVIETMYGIASYSIKDMTMNNCTIKKFYGFSTNNNANSVNITNCVIYSSSEFLPAAHYTNNIIRADASTVFRAPSVFTSNLFYAETTPTLNFAGCTHTGDMFSTFQEVFGGKENYPATPENVPNGNDGKPVGIYGGEGFQADSPVPITSSYYVSPVTTFLGDVHMKIHTNASSMRFWWNDDEASMMEFPVDESGIITQDLLVPDEAKWTRNMARGVAKLNVILVGPTGLISPPRTQNITFSKGVALQLTKKSNHEVALQWDYKGFDPSLGTFLYYSKNGGPFVLWRSDLYYGTYEIVYLSKGEYRFLVVMKDDSGNLSSMDEHWSEYIKIDN
ncbi:MAG: right-handed parallel beta-helix repeat-containing protein [Prevotella sp.]|nr:right-handed parallel beta-helix repeat-containing protein [Prevotella sp.]